MLMHSFDRFGRRYDAECKNITMRNGDKLAWVKSCRYLGVYFITGRLCKRTFENAKRQFYRSFNAIFSKVGQLASEEVIINLLRTKCLPTLLYAVDSCPVNARDKQSLEFTVFS